MKNANNERRMRLAAACLGGLAAVAFGASCVDTSPETTGSGGGCEGGFTSGPWPITTGEDHGPPWIPPEIADTPEEWLDLLPHDLPPGGSNPSSWEYDRHTGVHYRGVTEDEMEDNEWDLGTVLVILPQGVLDDFRVGAPTVFDLPLAEPPGFAQTNLPFASVDIEQQAQHDRLPFVSLGWSARGRLTGSSARPLIRFYLPVDLDWPLVDDVVLQVFASQTGFGVAVSGAAADRTFQLHGPYVPDAPQLLEIPLPVGDRFYVLHTQFDQVPGFFVSSGTGIRGIVGEQAAHVSFDLTLEASPPPTLVGTCADSLDNDKDTYGDGCDFECVPHYDFGGAAHDHVRAYEYTKNFGLFGDAAFCAQNPEAWQTMFSMWGMQAVDTLNQTEAPEPYAGDVRTPPFRMLGAACVFTMSFAEASACHLEVEHCPDGQENYPFAGVGSQWGASCGSNPRGYMAKVWNLVEAWAEITDASELHPLHSAVAVLSAPDGVGGQKPGKAYADFFPNTNRFPYRGTALVRGSEINGFGIAHEIGHTMGLAHDLVSFGPYIGFMYAFALEVAAPILNWDAPSLVPEEPTNTSCSEIQAGTFQGDILTQGQVWGQRLLSKWHPRPSGFKFRNCAHTGCSSDHPLQCPGVGGMCLPGGS